MNPIIVVMGVVGFALIFIATKGMREKITTFIRKRPGQNKSGK